MITPIENNGIIARMQDVSIIKSNEDNKAAMVQSHLNDIAKDENERLRQMIWQAEGSDKSNTRHDARDEGKNKYYNNRRDKKKKEEKKESDSLNSQSKFDVSI